MFAAIYMFGCVMAAWISFGTTYLPSNWSVLQPFHPGQKLTIVRDMQGLAHSSALSRNWLSHPAAGDVEDVRFKNALRLPS
jgi:hypothetical protein